ncbi:hypothetical protein SC1_04258 [Sphingopyxis sp. C-1]|nr:hypothetical protein SC1_04258 [Sphingopyxis sp. C-1]
MNDERTLAILRDVKKRCAFDQLNITAGTLKPHYKITLGIERCT